MYLLIFFAVLCGMLMTACDVSAIAKPWEQQHLLAKRVADEFFDQGDLEKLRLNTQPIVSENWCQHIFILFSSIPIYYSYANKLMDKQKKIAETYHSETHVVSTTLYRKILDFWNGLFNCKGLWNFIIVMLTITYLEIPYKNSTLLFMKK